MVSHLNTAERYALWAIVGHAVLLAIHSRAHMVLGIDPTPPQLAFIVTVIILAPVAAGVLLLTGRSRAGGMTLAASMAGSFFFGLYYHFVAISQDHVAHLPAHAGSVWPAVFTVSAVLLAAAAIPGVIAGVGVLRVLQRT